MQMILITMLQYKRPAVPERKTHSIWEQHPVMGENTDIIVMSEVSKLQE